MRDRISCSALLIAAALLPADAVSAAQPEEFGTDLKARRETLVFAPPPDGWKPRPADAKPFLHDYDLPAEAGEEAGARVNVLFYPIGFDDYRRRLLHRWTDAQGIPLKEKDQRVEGFEVNGLKVRTVEMAGTHAPAGRSGRPGLKLLAGHVRAPGGQWSVWLLGPAGSVDHRRRAFLDWLRTVRAVETPVPFEGDQAVRAVRWVHGAPAHGVPAPWALWGYRVGHHACGRLSVTRDRAWEIVVTCRAPREAGYAAVLDGLLASTGASPGQLNLVFEPAAEAGQTEVRIEHRPSGRKLTYRPVEALRRRLRDVSRMEFPEAAKALAALADAEAFVITEVREESR